MPFQLTKAGVSDQAGLVGVDEKGQFGAGVLVFRSIYMIRMGLRLVQMLGKKLQADDDVVQLAFCKFSSDGSNCKEPPIPPATANLRRQQSASAATRGAVAQRFSEAAPPKTNRRRVSFLAARGRYVEEVGARAAK